MIIIFDHHQNILAFTDPTCKTPMLDRANIPNPKVVSDGSKTHEIVTKQVTVVNASIQVIAIVYTIRSIINSDFNVYIVNPIISLPKFQVVVRT